MANKKIKNEIEVEERVSQNMKEKIIEDNHVIDKLKKDKYREEQSKTNETNKNEEKKVKINELVASIKNLEKLNKKNKEIQDAQQKKVREAELMKNENDHRKDKIKTDL